MLGIGVMIKQLGGNSEIADTFSAAIGKEISDVALGTDDALHFVFADGSKMKIADEGQYCCESRYMRTDDNLADFVGATLTGGEVKPAPSVKDSEYGESHDVEFLEILTNKGSFTMSSHNEHNGYYGGFHVVASPE